MQNITAGLKRDFFLQLNFPTYLPSPLAKIRLNFLTQSHGTVCLCNNQFLILYTSALKMEVAYLSETLVSTSVTTKIAV
jgi:hypothetical protein